MKARKLAFIFVLILIATVSVSAQSNQQTQTSSQPLNSSVSGFGTSFSFGPTTICSGCVQTELGFVSVQRDRLMPTVITVAPFKSRTDVTLLFNAFESHKPENRRTTQFSNRVDLIVRQEILNKSGLVVSIAPQAAIFLRDGGGRVGATGVAQYGRGKNTFVVNYSVTKAIRKSESNPNWDKLLSFDYTRSLTKKGVAAFVGVQHDRVTGGVRTLNTEQGVVIPFKDGQLEFAVGQMNLTQNPTWQFQARVIVNWKKLFRRN